MKFTGILLNLDGVPDASGDVFTSRCKIKIPERVEVVMNFGYSPEAWLGYAKITREPKALKYEIDIVMSKLLPEMADRMTPAIGGLIKKRRGKKITDCTVNMVFLSFQGNADSRIKKLGEQK